MANKRVKVYSIKEFNLDLISTQDKLLKQLSFKKTLSSYQKTRIKEFQQNRITIKELKQKASRAKEQYTTLLAAKKYTNISYRKLNKIKARYRYYLNTANELQASTSKQLFRFLGINKKGIQSKRGRKIIQISKDKMVKLEVANFNKLKKLANIKEPKGKKPSLPKSEPEAVKAESVEGVCIGTYEMFKSYAINCNAQLLAILAEFGVISAIMSFLSDTSATWTRRVMNDLNICSYVDRFEFYDWLLQLAAEGIVKY